MTATTPAPSTVTTTTRHATLTDMVNLLRDQQGRKSDIVVPATHLHAQGGLIRVKNSEQILGPDGVTSTHGTYRPTEVFDEGIADKLGINLPYLRRIRRERPYLYDGNVNGWLHGSQNYQLEGSPVSYPAESRKFLVRLFKGDNGKTGVARALLSDKFNMIENLDVLMTTLDALRSLDVPIDIAGCDLSERRMFVRVVVPQISALAPTLLRNYRSPFSGASGAENPVVFAGLEISNSETGGGAFSVAPRLVVQVCKNGMTRTVDAMRQVHLGGKLEQGVITWSDETQQKNLALIKSKTRDAVTAFLNTDYLNRVIAETEEKSGTPVSDVAETLKSVSKKLQFTDEEQKGILDHFIKGGDPTAGGFLHAITSHAQTVTNADRASELEGLGFKALDLAAAAA